VGFSYCKTALTALAATLSIIARPVPALAQLAPTSVGQAVQMEAADALPLTGFYDTPPNLAAAQLGTLFRQEAFDGYALPNGMRAVRILYRSTDAEGRPVATSAVVLVPPGPTPKGGWPIIAWAHGTSGVARQCAPSLMKDISYGEEGLFPMVRAGYAVVATDYHGLGTEGPHQYLNKLAQAHDVIDAIPAARAAVEDLGSRWVVDGHSQGGEAAWAVAELEHARRDPGYLGAVAVAPASDLRDVLPAPPPSTAAAFYLDLIAFGIHARTPSFKPADMLTGVAIERYADMTTKGCYFYDYARFLGDTVRPPLKAGWDSTPAARRFFDESEIGFSPTGGPLLVIAGEADQTVPIAAVRYVAARACAVGVSLQFVAYPGLDHDPTIDKSTPDQLAWIADRFAGKPAVNGCRPAKG
jgi:pimeloyl-ACP methyl ester carboxylesterase